MPRQVYQVKYVPDELKKRIRKAAERKGVLVWEMLEMMTAAWEKSEKSD